MRSRSQSSVTFESDGKQWFNPDVSVIYPDRIRRRRPERPPKVLERIPTPGRWNAGCFQRISAFRQRLNGNLAQYDPWHAAHRTEVEEYTVDNTTKCSVFDIPGLDSALYMLPG
ncbi:protein [Escherichia coli]|uniref:Protein n=1 Tax=Escherichia coli TaxID=562 RepID=A0A376ZQ11_ECOLX|nr:protein [Escherichia coli]